MTLLGILFVLGIALLASMNFEAKMIAAESSRSASQTGVANVAANATAVLRDTMMFGPDAPFGGPSIAPSSAFADFQTSYAEMPGVHNSFSPIEPFREDNGTAILVDDRVLYPWFTDLVGLKRVPFSGPVMPWGTAIDTSMFSGQIAIDADFDGVPETPVVDADGDGIVDSVQRGAALLGLTEAQVAELAAQLNPPGNPGGTVYVALRIIPHTGLVNLNASHPNLIRTALDLLYFPPNGATPDPAMGGFVHRPTQFQVAYPPFQDEAALRRRGLLAPRQVAPSWLHGNPLLNLVREPAGRSDMASFLYAPIDPTASDFETVYDKNQDGKGHRYAAFEPDEPFDARAADSPPLWAMRMEPATSDLFDDNPNDGVTPQLDRRHLVTTISHDGLLAPPAHVPNSILGTSEDLLAKMRQVNQAAHDLNVCPPLLPNGLQGLPFEYADYPHTVQDDCHQDLFDSDAFCHCPTCVDCTPNVRKGRMQLSLPWLDEVYVPDKDDTNDYLPKHRRDRLIYDAFLMLLSNASGPYWGDVRACATNANCDVACIKRQPTDAAGFCSDCMTDGDCPAFEYCWPVVGDAAPGACRDRVTDQLHRPNVITRTAAALTANMIDYVDLECAGGSRDLEPCAENADCPSGTCADRGIPTRIPLRSFDFIEGVCDKGSNLGRACLSDANCGTGAGANACDAPLRAAGREFDFEPRKNGPNHFGPTYVYGLERQPYLTEVAVVNGPPPHPIQARAVEVFNPYRDVDIGANGTYFIVEYEPGVGARPRIPLTGQLPANSGGANPFTVYASGIGPAIAALMAPRAVSDARILSTPLAFKNGWTIYLVRLHQYAGEPNPTEIVVDQITIADEAASCIGKEGPAFIGAGCVRPPPLIFSQQRGVDATNPWTAPVPINPETKGGDSLGDGGVPDATLHPVELQFANLGTFTQPFRNPRDPANNAVAFPTTGSLLTVLRHGNRSMLDAAATTDLAFTTRLVDETQAFKWDGTAFAERVVEQEQIDNGRMPVFDRPKIAGAETYAAHHLIGSQLVPPPAGAPGPPGSRESLPWGQRVFDYFTALPLSNAGPYFVDTNVVTPADPAAQPRVDLDGLRVQGRINLNAAPWKVLSGLPFVPMQRIPVPWRDRVRTALGYVDPASRSFSPLDTEAGSIGEPLAHAIVAYRELRPLPGGATNRTGNYNDGNPPVGTPPVVYARGWAAPNPMARRGTGFASVGELANIRHPGALASGLGAGFPQSFYRIDGGYIDDANPNKNDQNFVQAAAALIALGDWVTVRSDVFTVYGVLRGEVDLSIIDPDPGSPPTVEQLRARDVDSRALRFQETIDRLPTVLGEPAPTRIGPRHVGRYTDVRND